MSHRIWCRNSINVIGLDANRSSSGVLFDWILVGAFLHNKKDKNSHLLKHAKSKKHKRVSLPDFKILNSGYTTDFKRKISESLYIKKHKPEINIQKDAYILKLFY